MIKVHYSRIDPSFIFMISSTKSRLSKIGSCVAIIIVLFNAFNFLITSINFNEFPLSKFAVGSSQRIISGLFTKALAIAVLCFSPPERFDTVSSFLCSIFAAFTYFLKGIFFLTKIKISIEKENN